MPRHLVMAMLATLALPEPVPAQTSPPTDPTTATTRCAADSAGWWFGEDTQGRPEGSKPIVRPSHTWGYIWTCAVAGRRLVIKHQAGYRIVGPCSAEVTGAVSVWVDAVKLVSDGEIGDYASCFSLPQIVSFTFDRSGVLRECETQNRGDDSRIVCKNIRTRSPRTVDARYAPPGRRTYPGLRLRYTMSPICGPLTRRLKPPPAPASEDLSLAALTVPGTPYFDGSPKGPIGEDGPEPIHAAFDVDNDGLLDEVDFGYSTRLHGPEAGRISWRRGGRGAPKTARELPGGLEDVRNLPKQDDYATFATRAVRIEGRTYLYLRRHGVLDDLADPEAVYGANRGGAAVVTRGLIELHPDGSSSLTCGWGPRLRPEEFL